MKVVLESKNYNTNDNTMCDLVLRGVVLGQYKQGDYDKWELAYINKNKKVIPSLENYICGILHNKYNIPVLTKEDVLAAQELLIKDTGLSIINWFEKSLKENNL